MDGARIGIYGGAFDPPHLGHLALARLARDRFGLAETLFVPTPEPPHKRQPAASFAEAPAYTVARIDAGGHRGHGRARHQQRGHRRHGGQDSRGQDGGVAVCGYCSFIGPSGSRDDVVRALFSGEPVGTFFLPDASRAINSRKHWIAYVLRPEGELVLDAGVARALVNQGKSLLPSGIVEVRGQFGAGAPVHCLDGDGALVAAGLANYASADMARIRGKKTSEIAAILGHKDLDESIHRDNLVLFGGGAEE